jgi:Fe-S cluster assembly protein SufB
LISTSTNTGFVTDIESDKAPKGLSEDIVCFISAKKNEPAWMLEWRLNAYRRWLTMREPQWARVDYGPIDYQDLYYYSAPKRKAMASLDEVDPEIIKTCFRNQDDPSGPQSSSSKGR